MIAAAGLLHDVSVAFDPVGSWTTLAVVTAALAAVLFAVGPDRSRVTPGRRLVLVLVRLAAFVALIACMTRPTIVATKKARGLLPEQVPHVDAAWNAARSALLLAALTTRPDLLLEATDDRIHQPYRRPAYPRSTDLVAKLRARGIPAAVSGAGPTVIALADAATAPGVTALAGARFATTVLEVDTEGARVLPLDT